MKAHRNIRINTFTQMFMKVLICYSPKWKEAKCPQPVNRQIVADSYNAVLLIKKKLMNNLYLL